MQQLLKVILIYKYIYIPKRTEVFPKKCFLRIIHVIMYSAPAKRSEKNSNQRKFTFYAIEIRFNIVITEPFMLITITADSFKQEYK